MLKKLASIIAGFFLGISLTICLAGDGMAKEKPNLNTATQNELATTPGIGEAMAIKIVEQRSDLGDFTSWEDIKAIEGMTDDIFKKLTEQFQILGVESTDCNC